MKCFQTAEELRKGRLRKENGFQNMRKSQHSFKCVNELVCDYLRFFQEEDISNMLKIIIQLQKISKNDHCNPIDEFNGSDILQKLCTSLLFKDSTFHIELLRFFCSILKFSQQQSIDLLVNNGFLILLMHYIDFDDEGNLYYSLKCISLLIIHSNKVSNQLLKKDCLEIFFQIIQEDSYIEDIRIESGKILVLLSKFSLNQSELDNILIIVRQIFGDKMLSLIWEHGLEIIFNLIVNNYTANYIMVDKEFCEILNNFLNCNDDSYLVNTLLIFYAYFENSSKKIDINYIIFVNLCLSDKQNIAEISLMTIKKIIQDNLINEIINYNLFDNLKVIIENGSFKNKYLAASIISDIIRNDTIEIINYLINLDFIGSLVLLLEMNDLKFFNLAIGAITRLLRKNISFEPNDIFWIQFENGGGIEVLENLVYQDCNELSNRAKQFLEKIYSLRP